MQILVNITWNDNWNEAYHGARSKKISKSKSQFGTNPATFWDEIVLHHHDPEVDLKVGEPIWIAFDEARHLFSDMADDDGDDDDGGTSDFRILRRALANVSRRVGYRLFVILVDSKSGLASSPRSKAKKRPISPSHRPSSYGSHVFHPFILLSTYDAWKQVTAIDFTDPWAFVNCGRPLWKSRYPNSRSRLRMLEYASELLSQTRGGVILDELALLAIVICRTGMYLSPQASMASDFAANKMATLLLCDWTHEHFLVTYLSDPVLTIASAKLWYEKEQYDLLVTRALPALRRKVRNGAFLEGYLDELVGRLLLLIGMDNTSAVAPPSGTEAAPTTATAAANPPANTEAVQPTGATELPRATRSFNSGNGYDGGWYRVADFMKHCFGITDCLTGESAYMGFSHFIPYAEEPTTYEALQDLLYRRGACCLPSSQRGINLLIPFWINTKPKPLFSYILVHVKNKSRPENVALMRDKMNPKNCFAKGSELRAPLGNIILIMMEIGLRYKPTMWPAPKHVVDEPQGSKKRTKKVQVEDWKKWVYSVRGISPQSYPFLEGPGQKLLEELVRLSKGAWDSNGWMASNNENNKPNTSPIPEQPDHIFQFIFGSDVVEEQDDEV